MTQLNLLANHRPATGGKARQLVNKVVDVSRAVLEAATTFLFMHRFNWREQRVAAREAAAVRFGVWPKEQQLPDATYAIPPDACRLLGMLPLHLDDEGIWLAVDDPTRVAPVAAASAWTMLPVHLVVVPSDRLWTALTELMPSTADHFERLAADRAMGPVRRALVEQGGYSPDDVRRLDRQALEAGQPLLTYLGARSAADEGALAELMAAFHGVGCADPRTEVAERGACSREGLTALREEHHAVPLSMAGPLRRVAMVNPTDEAALRACLEWLGPVLPVVGAPQAIDDAAGLLLDEVRRPALSAAVERPDGAAPVLDLLRAAGVVDEHVAQLARLQDPGDRLHRLTTLGGVDEGALCEALGHVHGVPAVDLDEYDPEPDCVDLVPASLGDQLGLIPLGRVGALLIVATSRPGDLAALDEVRFLTGYDIAPVAAAPAAIARAWTRAEQLPALPDRLERIAGALEVLAEAEDDVDDWAATATKRQQLIAPFAVALFEIAEQGCRRLRIEDGADESFARRDGGEPTPLPAGTARGVGALCRVTTGTGWAPTGRRCSGVLGFQWSGRRLDAHFEWAGARLDVWIDRVERVALL